MNPIERLNILKNIVEDYLRAFSARDLDKCLALFTDDCVVRSPYGEIELTGKAAWREHIEAMKKTWYYYNMRIDNFYPGDPDRIAVRWSVSATATNSKTAEFSGISIFYFRGELITGLDSYWHNRWVMSEIA